MTEIAVKFASRYIKRQWSDAVGKSLLKTLTEPITNSDDSYRKIAESEVRSDKAIFAITIFVDKKKRLVRITDQAQGMTEKELEEKFEEYGAAKSAAYEGYSSRGVFGQGISDVLFYHREGKIKSIKDGEASICSFYEKKGRPYISVEKQKEPIGEIAKEWGINNERGTVVEFTLDNTTIHDYDNLIKKLSVFFMLRLINANDRRTVKLIYKDTRETKRSLIKYQFPHGELVEHKEFMLQFEDYDPVKIDVELYKAPNSLQTIGDERENGLLVYDDKEAVYAQTFFGWDNLPGADKFFGFMKLTGAREIILNKINDPKHPEAVLSDSRDGFNTQHDFYKKLSSEVRDWLYPILNEERRKRTNEGVSESTI
ncbi:MAG: ATP-binding protein, partial [bacterium]|nr:ATP-binding protein [bacterium]